MRLSGFSPRRALQWALVAAALGAAIAACDAHLVSECFDGPCVPTDASATTAGTGGTSATTTDATTTTGTGTVTNTCGPSKDGSDMCSDAAAEGDFPKDVFAILEAKCHVCHDADHLAGAPIDLLTCSRFHEPDCGPSRTRFRTASYYLCIDFMPQGSNKLTADEKKTLTDWLAACAPCVPAGTGATGVAGAKKCYE